MYPSSNDASQSVPGSCLIALLGMFSATLPGVGLWGLYVWATQAVEKRQVDDTFWLLISVVIGGGFLSGLIFFLSWRSFKNTNFKGYDSRDPTEPPIKW